MFKRSNRIRECGALLTAEEVRELLEMPKVYARRRKTPYDFPDARSGTLEIPFPSETAQYRVREDGTLLRTAQRQLRDGQRAFARRINRSRSRIANTAMTSNSSAVRSSPPRSATNTEGALCAPVFPGRGTSLPAGK